MNIEKEFGVTAQTDQKLADKLNNERFFKEYPEYFNIKFSDLKKLKKLSTVGSFSTVYKCMYMDQMVVAKLVTFGKDKYKYLKREIKIFKKLDHPNIIKYIGVTHSNNFKNLYIIMEYMNGGDLSEIVLNKKKKPNWHVILDMSAKITSGLIYLDSLGILHRDLKAHNILLSKDFQDVKICDFGTARKKPKSQNSCLTRVGTAYYMSPEVMKKKEYDEQSDVFSLGIIFLQLLGVSKIRKQNLTIDFAAIEQKRDKNAPVGYFELAMDCIRDNPQLRPPFVEVFSLLEIVKKQYSEVVPLKSSSSNVLNDESSVWNFPRRHSPGLSNSLNRNITPLESKPPLELTSPLASSPALLNSQNADKNKPQPQPQPHSNISTESSNHDANNNNNNNNNNNISSNSNNINNSKATEDLISMNFEDLLKALDSSKTRLNLLKDQKQKTISLLEFEQKNIEREEKVQDLLLQAILNLKSHS